MAMAGLSEETNDGQCILLDCWWLSLNICHWSGAVHVRVNRGPKQPKRDSVSNG
jgi:hypothetical protein